MISPDEKLAYCKICMPQRRLQKKWYKTVSAEMQQYYDEHRIAYEKIPVHNPNCEKGIRRRRPGHHRPRNGAEYLISSKHRSHCSSPVRTGNDVSKVYLVYQQQIL